MDNILNVPDRGRFLRPVSECEEKLRRLLSAFPYLWQQKRERKLSCFESRSFEEKTSSSRPAGKCHDRHGGLQNLI